LRGAGRRGTTSCCRGEPSSPCAAREGGDRGRRRGIEEEGYLEEERPAAAVPMTSPVLHLSDLMVFVALDPPTPPRHRCRQGAAATPK
jgi:hypothetical protein